MTDKVLCPYCGNEMIGQNVMQVFGVYWAQAECEHCKSTGPLICSERGLVTDAEEMARKSALAVAQARYLPPNRPLTLEEVNALPADDDGNIPCFIEVEPGWYEKDVDDFNPRLCADVISKPSLSEPTYYNKDYRVWLRKPTQAEMDAAGWGEENAADS
nr:MAG TPA: cysteine-rich protein [Bacteriophage sp.]